MTPNDVSKPSSANLKTEKKLLHFGVDYLTLNICEKADNKSQSAKYLDTIFSFPHNTTNSNSLENFVWADSMQEVKIIFSESPDGEVAQVHQGNHYLFQIAKIDHQSSKWKNTKYKYKYRLQFYGDFFNSVRREKVNQKDFFSPFLEDIQKEKVKNSISRLDLCADISNIRPKKIFKGIKGTHLKKVSILEGDKETGEMETFYYGKRKNNNAWLIRCYDKLEDCRGKSKESLYTEYFFYEHVTRIEAEIKTDTLKSNQVDLVNIQNFHFLWSLYASFLNTKYNSWNIYPFLKKEMKKHGLKKITLEKRDHEIIPLSRERYAKRFISSSLTFLKRYQSNPAIYTLEKIPELKDETLRYLIGDSLQMRISSNQNHFSENPNKGTIKS